MQTPNSMMELLDERIKFCQNYIDGTRNLTTNNETVSEFTKALVDFKYCKKLLIKVKDNPLDNELKVKFKKLATKIVADLYYTVETQEYESISICGITFLTKTKSYLPQEQKDNLAELKTAFGKIFKEINYEI